MFHNIRAIHRWVGLINALFLVVIATTGFLLSIKKRADWLQPPTKSGGEIAQFSEVVPLERVAQTVFAQGLPELQTKKDMDRFELHVGKNTFKVTSKSGYREVQVDAKTGELLSIGRRNDSFMEQIHDMSFFSAWMHDWILPAVAVCLFLLGCSGIYMFFVPVLRRRAYRRRAAQDSVLPNMP
jgi:uncharacterized iron-regulated membrane protein